MRDIINTKEHEISVKEEDVTKLKRLVELETSEKEIEIKRVRAEIDDQKKVIDNQKKIIQELQVVNDFTQQDLIKAAKDLQRKNEEKKDLELKLRDCDQDTTNLRWKQNTLEEQITILIQQKNGSEKVTPLSSQRVEKHLRSRSQLAMFYVDNKDNDNAKRDSTNKP